MKDLTKGNITKLIFGFAIPLLFGNVFQLFYNLADTRIVGQFLGDTSLGAIGATWALNSVIVGFLNGLTNGFGLVTARFFGAKEYDRMRKTVAHSITLGLATSAVLTTLSLVFTRPLLEYLNTPSEIINQSKSYICIIFAGMTISMTYNICAGILRAIGDTISPLVFLIIATIVNIILDLFFISVLDFGVEGAAYATLIAQAVSAILCIIYILKKHRILVPKLKDFKFNGRMAGEMYATGVSMGLMISLVGIGTVLIQGAINNFGTKIIVAHTTARKISDMYMLPISVFGMAAATFSSQNYGAEKIDRVRKGLLQTTIITWGWSVIVIAITWVATPFLVRLITGIDNPETVKVVVQYMKINTAFYFVLDIVIVFRNALQGVGDKISPIASSALELVGKCLMAKFLAPKLGYFGIIINEPIVWIGMAVILAAGFVFNKTLGFRKKKTPVASVDNK